MSYTAVNWLSRMFVPLPRESHMAAWKKWLNSQPFAPSTQGSPVTLAELRDTMAGTLEGCQGPMCERMRWRIADARAAQDLWLLRSEIFQLVSSQHCQSEAVTRINGLLPAFEGWLPSRLLTPV
jgi:hypothetical protein